MKVYQAIASKLAAIANCKVSGNTEWEARHSDAVKELVRDYLPSGSGFDVGTKLGDESTPSRLVFRVSYHHMDEGGSYDGWTDHAVIVTASRAHGFDTRITGRDRKRIKDYIGDEFRAALWQEWEGTK